jgi:ABC-type sugar transport system ATPase subunit
MITLQNISKDLGEFHLRDVSMEIYDGEYFVFIGPTGAGKSILLETLAGIYTPDKGRILMDGRDITNIPSRERNIGMVYQDYALFPYLNVDDNIAFGLKNRKMEKQDIRDKVDELKEFLGIAHLAHRYPGTLSGGEQQKVAMARAIAIEPRVLLLDEPLSALDSQTKSHLRDGLTKVNKEYGITMVHVTHDQTEGIILADRIGVLMHGQLMQVGDSKEIFNRPVNEEMASFVGMENILYGSVVGSDEGIAEVRTTDGDTIFALTDLSEGEVRVYVRPEDILLSTEECDSSAQNHVLSSIASLQDMGPLVRVTLANGIVSLVTKRALHSMGLVVGLELYAAFKATSAHVAKD